MLADDGYAVVKIWLHISQEEQRRRLRDSNGETLRWPGSRADDWKQYRKHREYRPLVEEMLAQSDVEGLRWTLIAANNPYFAQWRVLQTVASALEAGLTELGVLIGAEEAPDEADHGFTVGVEEALLKSSGDFG
jgi:polyphosphate kinase 2 (PPK2 family)